METPSHIASLGEIFMRKVVRLFIYLADEHDKDMTSKISVQSRQLAPLFTRQI